MESDRKPPVNTPILLTEQFNTGIGRVEVAPILIASVLWFKSEDVDEVNEANRKLRLKIENTLRQMGARPGEAPELERQEEKYGLVNLFSPDARTSISFTGRYIEVRCGEMKPAEAWDRFNQLMGIILGYELYPRNSGIAIEFQGITQDFVTVQDPGQRLQVQLLKGYNVKELESILPAPIAGANLRLFFGDPSTSYTFDIGPDLLKSTSLFVRLRSKRRDHCTLRLFFEAWKQDLNVWTQMPGKFVEISIRGES